MKTNKHLIYAKLKQAREIRNFLIEFLPDPVYGLAHWHNLDNIKDMISNKHLVLIVEEKTNKIIGCMGLYVYHDDEYINILDIDVLAVRKHYRKRGYGTQLVDFAVKLAKEQGIPIIKVGSLKQFKAKKFYLKKKFELSYCDKDNYEFSMNLTT